MPLRTGCSLLHTRDLGVRVPCGGPLVTHTSPGAAWGVEPVTPGPSTTQPEAPDLTTEARGPGKRDQRDVAWVPALELRAALQDSEQCAYYCPALVVLGFLGRG